MYVTQTDQDKMDSDYREPTGHSSIWHFTIQHRDGLSVYVLPGPDGRLTDKEHIEPLFWYRRKAKGWRRHIRRIKAARSAA